MLHIYTCSLAHEQQTSEAQYHVYSNVRSSYRDIVLSLLSQNTLSNTRKQNNFNITKRLRSIRKFTNWLFGKEHNNFLAFYYRPKRSRIIELTCNAQHNGQYPVGSDGYRCGRHDGRLGTMQSPFGFGSLWHQPIDSLTKPKPTAESVGVGIGSFQ